MPVRYVTPTDSPFAPGRRPAKPSTAVGVRRPRASALRIRGRVRHPSHRSRVVLVTGRGDNERRGVGTRRLQMILAGSAETPPTGLGRGRRALSALTLACSVPKKRRDMCRNSSHLPNHSATAGSEVETGARRIDPTRPMPTIRVSARRTTGAGPTRRAPTTTDGVRGEGVAGSKPAAQPLDTP
jgi:hypothetical protein